jgi:hypothetical protein
MGAQTRTKHGDFISLLHFLRKESGLNITVFFIHIKYIKFFRENGLDLQTGRIVTFCL